MRKGYRLRNALQAGHCCAWGCFLPPLAPKAYVPADAFALPTANS